MSNTGPAAFGNAGRNIVRGPSLQEWDFSLLKSFPIHEQMRQVFRAEFFNAFNHPNLLWGPIGARDRWNPLPSRSAHHSSGFLKQRGNLGRFSLR